jgi:hypothetical protein
MTTIGSSLILIPLYGILGAAIGDLVGQIVVVVVYEFFSSRLYKVAWRLAPTLLAITGFFAMYFLSVSITFVDKVGDLIFRSGLLVVFFLFVAFFVDRGKIIRSLWQVVSKE